jgi:hypothetical protein
MLNPYPYTSAVTLELHPQWYILTAFFEIVFRN